MTPSPLSSPSDSVGLGEEGVVRVMTLPRITAPTPGSNLPSVSLGLLKSSFRKMQTMVKSALVAGYSTRHNLANYLGVGLAAETRMAPTPVTQVGLASQDQYTLHPSTSSLRKNLAVFPPCRSRQLTRHLLFNIGTPQPDQACSG